MTHRDLLQWHVAFPPKSRHSRPVDTSILFYYLDNEAAGFAFRTGPAKRCITSGWDKFVAFLSASETYALQHTHHTRIVSVPQSNRRKPDRQQPTTVMTINGSPGNCFITSQLKTNANLSNKLSLPYRKDQQFPWEQDRTREREK